MPSKKLQVNEKFKNIYDGVNIRISPIVGFIGIWERMCFFLD